MHHTVRDGVEDDRRFVLFISSRGESAARQWTPHRSRRTPWAPPRAHRSPAFVLFAVAIARPKRRLLLRPASSCTASGISSGRTVLLETLKRPAKLVFTFLSRGSRALGERSDIGCRDARRRVRRGDLIKTFAAPLSSPFPGLRRSTALLGGFGLFCFQLYQALRLRPAGAQSTQSMWLGGSQMGSMLRFSVHDVHLAG